MAAVTLSGIWVHDASDLSDYVQVRTLRQAGFTDEVPGEVIELAGGRYVWRRRPSQGRTYRATVFCTSRSDRDRLATMVGREVMVRDSVGHLQWGVYRDVTSTEVGADMREVVFELVRTSASAEV